MLWAEEKLITLIEKILTKALDEQQKVISKFQNSKLLSSKMKSMN